MEHENQSATEPAAPRWVGFGAAIGICFRKYVDFTGRAGRPEFWFWTLFQNLALFLPLAAATLISRPDIAGSDQGAQRVAVLFVISLVALLLPSLAVTVRRLHDINFSGWWILINLVPAGGLALLILVCKRGTEGANRFGPQSAI
jgi:uncharacterized membrane protein YhaH (DUF805 family)